MSDIPQLLAVIEPQIRDSFHAGYQAAQQAAASDRAELVGMLDQILIDAERDPEISDVLGMGRMESIANLVAKHGGWGMSDWQPIETYPKDGTSFLVWSKNCTDLSIAWHDEEGEPLERFYTHWHPLPPPPK